MFFMFTEFIEDIVGNIITKYSRTARALPEINFGNILH